MEDKYLSLESWTLPPAFGEDFWVSDAFAHESETLTRALQICLSPDADVFSTAGPPFFVNPARLTPSSASASDEEAPARLASRPVSYPELSPPAAGKISKRKPRASRRSATTFITADPANFREMVQQVTGIPFPRKHAAAEAEGVLRPEPRRANSRVASEGGCIPTLDTSAFLLERAAAAAPTGSLDESSPRSRAFFGSALEGSGFGTDPSFPAFPTLESWGVM